MQNGTLLSMKGIYKSFPGVNALVDIDFEVARGEIHGLIGENGAGKSTLIKVLTGLYQPDQGQIIFDGKSIEPKTPLAAQELGISTIYQELNLVPYQTVYENIHLGREICNGLGILKRKKMIALAKTILDDLGLDVDVTRPLGSYSTAIQQMVAIARAISINCKLVVMDEPTSSLDTDEVKVLFRVIRHLKQEGISVIFISHRLDELFEICDRVTILKDGKKVAEDAISDFDRYKLVSLMIGRSYVSSERIKSDVSFADYPFVLRAKGIYKGLRLSGLDIDIRVGEIVGLAGLLGSGRTELARILFGADQPDEGEIVFLDIKRSYSHPRHAISSGMGFLTEDRKMEGIIPHLSVKENMTLANLSQISKFGIIDRRKEIQIVQKYIDALQIKTPSQNQLIRNLSGGNQQKVLLARWMCINPMPRLIILDEPTRGIDVGAKAEIESLIQAFAKQGISILMISSELEELERNCDRAIVIREGKNIGELFGRDINQTNIMNIIAASHTRRENT